ncbi:uncharacterized protein [Eurosta solidaginis]|uniref:uncharacterized protein n=1 Tax=Eurosta solidaginis TaxID=178769 RepID=UPI003530C865
MDKENVIKHYWECASALEPATHTHKLLKSYYMTICRKLANSGIQMPQEKFSHSTMCARCCSKWNETDYRMRLKPQEIAKSTKAKKQIAKLNEPRSGIEQCRVLTRKQRKRAKWLQKRVGNSMEMQCEFCQHKTTIEMNKPSRKERELRKSKVTDLDEQKQTTCKAVPSTAVKIKNKKKKKNKDKSAGIKVEKGQAVVLHKIKPKVEPSQNETKYDGDRTTKIEALKQKRQKVASQGVILNVQKPVVPNKSAQNLIQPLKAKKKKKKTPTPNALSKTKQQNSLLQLAALLKAQTTNKSCAKGTQNRLELLLK